MAIFGPGGASPKISRTPRLPGASQKGTGGPATLAGQQSSIYGERIYLSNTYPYGSSPQSNREAVCNAKMDWYLGYLEVAHASESGSLVLNVATDVYAVDDCSYCSGSISDLRSLPVLKHTTGRYSRGWIIA
jgi:hypothetical protein